VAWKVKPGWSDSGGSLSRDNGAIKPILDNILATGETFRASSVPFDTRRKMGR
jgi:hypothetical protein